MRWPVVHGRRKRTLAVYSDPAEGYAEFKSIWSRMYGGRCPTIEDARKWTGSDREETWLEIVHSVYPCNKL